MAVQAVLLVLRGLNLASDCEGPRRTCPLRSEHNSLATVYWLMGSVIRPVLDDLTFPTDQ